MYVCLTDRSDTHLAECNNKVIYCYACGVVVCKKAAAVQIFQLAARLSPKSFVFLCARSPLCRPACVDC